jgi:hypothetical protein
MFASLLLWLAAISFVQSSRVYRSFQGDPNVYYCGDLTGYFALVSGTNLQGLNYSQVQNITSFYGANLVNVDTTNIDDVLALYQQCLSGEFSSAWIGYYKALASPFGCSWTIGSNGHDIVSSSDLCLNGVLPMIVKFPSFTTRTNFFSTVYSTTTNHISRTLRITTTGTTVTNVITLGNQWVTETDISTETFSIENSGNQGDNQGDQKLRSLIPFSQCATQLHNFSVVFNADTTTYQTTYDEDCGFYNLIRANLTTNSLAALIPMFTSCTQGIAHVVFNSFNGYTPLCGQVNSNIMILNDFEDGACTNPSAVLCFGGSSGSMNNVITVNTNPPTKTVPAATRWSLVIETDNIDTTTISLTKYEASIVVRETRTTTVSTTLTILVLLDTPLSSTTQ